MKIVIYGAQGIALGAYEAIKTLLPEIKIECFLVTKRDNNAYKLGNLPVLELSGFAQGLKEAEMEELLFLIATPENVMAEIETNLDTLGLRNHVRLDSIRWAKLQEQAYIKNGKFSPLSMYLVGCHKPKIQVFKMIHCKDKKLATDFSDSDYVTSLQVGAFNSESIIADNQDNRGNNISDKNGNYSELTGLYWMWKNKAAVETDVNCYYGLAHYRRYLDLAEDDLLRLEDNEVDVVLPYPMPYEPNMEAHHLRYVSDFEWSAVLQALEELEPEYLEAFQSISKQSYMFNYNVILAKRDVLNDYCNWLFPVLFRTEQINDPNGEKAPNRYMGYIAETLETLYFMYNKQGYKIAHCGCRFLT